MTTNAQRTPTPWVLTDDGYITAGDTYVWEPNNLGREVQEGEIIPAEVMANARFIVHACNSHDELLAAAEAALEVWSVDPTHLPPGGLPEHWTRLVGSIARLRAAIAKAKGVA